MEERKQGVEKNIPQNLSGEPGKIKAPRIGHLLAWWGMRLEDQAEVSDIWKTLCAWLRLDFTQRQGGNIEKVRKILGTRLDLHFRKMTL